MTYARLIAGTWIEVAGSFTVGDSEDAVQYPAGWLDGATPEQLAELGVVEIVDDPAPADALKLTGQTLVDVGGVPHRQWVVPAIGDIRIELRRQLAAIRWDQQQTMKWRGRVVASDDTTLGRIMAAVMQSQLTQDQTTTVQWKFGDNDFATLTLADLTAYGMAIGAHLQACYDREAELVDAINSTVGVVNVTAIDLTGGWPA
jgi:hypothetical protein